MDKYSNFVGLYSGANGELMDRPDYVMLGLSGREWLVPHEDEMIPLPKGAVLVSVPGRLPVAMDKRGRARIMKGLRHDEPVQAVAALLPQGFTRTLLPAYVSPPKDEGIPLFGYTAVGFRDEKIWVAAIKTDDHRKWHPVNYNTAGLLKRIDKMLHKYPANRIIQQLAKCSVEYGCYTAQNLFYGRWEAGIPTIARCNAVCLGCISESHYEGNSPQQRLVFQPTIDEIIEVGVEHLTHAQEGIISFGQGCEGEPALNSEVIAPAITVIRNTCRNGTININTNAGYTKGIQSLCRAGLDALRVTIFSCQPENYNRYHQPRDYRLTDVENSIIEAKSRGLRVALNLLTFPGFTDREEEVEKLIEFVGRNNIDVIQLRNLNIDPERLFSRLTLGGKPIGIVNFVKLIRKEIPTVNIGSYTHPVK